MCEFCCTILLVKKFSKALGGYVVNKTISSYRNDSQQFSYNHNLSRPPNTNVNIHIHDTYELYYFLSGDVTYYIEGQTYKLQNNDILIINNRELHKPNFDSTKDYERITIHFLPEYVSLFQEKEYDVLHLYEKRKLGYYNRLNAVDIMKYDIQNFFDQIEEQIKKDLPKKHVIIKTLFIQMLVKLNEIFSLKKDSMVEAFEYDSKIVSILDYINNNLSQKITLDLLEKKFYINKYYLCHIFKKNTGFTVMEYITHKRIMKAKELLSVKTPVIETCHAVGFNDYSNFYKVFRKLVGMSPRDFSR